MPAVIGTIGKKDSDQARTNVRTEGPAYRANTVNCKRMAKECSTTPTESESSTDPGTHKTYIGL